MMKKQTDINIYNAASFDADKIIERISYLRVKILKMSQKEFSDAIGISQTYLSLIENHKRDLTNEILPKICTCLNVNPDWLINGTEDEKDFFQTGTQSRKLAVQAMKKDALDHLRSSYSLKDEELDFIEKLLSISSRERTSLIRAIRILKDRL